MTKYSGIYFHNRVWIFIPRSNYSKKKPGVKTGIFGVANGARTHDPQNHNLML